MIMIIIVILIELMFIFKFMLIVISYGLSGLALWAMVVSVTLSLGLTPSVVRFRVSYC